jgi:hypothetical protein
VYREAAALLDWCFEAGDAVQPVGTLAEPLAKAAQTPGASTSGSSQASATKSVTPADPDAMVRTGTAAALSALIVGCSFALRRRPVPKQTAGRRRKG